MVKICEIAKYNGKWAVYFYQSRTYSFIGCGKKVCEQKVKEFNSNTDNKPVKPDYFYD